MDSLTASIYRFVDDYVVWPKQRVIDSLNVPLYEMKIPNFSMRKKLLVLK